jgi:hypothetical protein
MNIEEYMELWENEKSALDKLDLAIHELPEEYRYKVNVAFCDFLKAVCPRLVYADKFAEEKRTMKSHSSYFSDILDKLPEKE